MFLLKQKYKYVVKIKFKNKILTKENFRKINSLKNLKFLNKKKYS